MEKNWHKKFKALLQTEEGKQFKESFNTKKLNEQLQLLERLEPVARKICERYRPKIEKDFEVAFLPDDPDELIEFLYNESGYTLPHPVSIKSRKDIIDVVKSFYSLIEKEWQNEAHTGLYNDLVNSEYISGDQDVFSHVMKFRQLPGGAEKIKWLTKKVDAMYFQKELNFTVKQLNDCFVPSDGKQFREGNRTSTVPEDPLPDILQNFSTQ